ncbi:MAG TPA: chemotaxis protein CheW [Ferrovibrio sp.]|jgi:purine-binding chemotaxis protein CheW|uniref:chemotaxis protein CheW n=1 Tax=Ferrovibrio sp. TaxID=1917215 RepID=UPI002ED4CB6D
MPSLIFELDRQRFAIGIAAVEEVLPFVPARHVPQVPAIVEGIVDLRGAALPVLDIRARFGLPPKPDALSDHLIVVRIAGRRLALHVDRAGTVAELPDEAVTAAAAIVPGSRYISGVAQFDGDIIFIHDPELFLRETELAALAEFDQAVP